MTEALRVALIGAGIGASLAPAFHERAGELAGIELSYDLIERPGDSVDDIRGLIERCRAEGYAALNITYPFKEQAFGSAQVDDPSVRQIGAVNTIVFEGSDAVLGANTDFSGLLRRWRLGWPDVTPGVVALIGSGGVGRSTAFALAELGAVEVRLVDVDAERSRSLSAALLRRFPDLVVRAMPTPEEAVEGATGVVNATPVGMYFNPGSPVDLDAVGAQSWLFEVVYSPVDTALVQRANVSGMRVLNGFELFLGQGFDAFEHFTGQRLTDADAATLESEMWQRLASRVL